MGDAECQCGGRVESKKRVDARWWWAVKVAAAAFTPKAPAVVVVVVIFVVFVVVVVVDSPAKRVGHMNLNVLELHRVRFGPFFLGDLPPGAAREVKV
jgi:hypothetical protein